MMYAQDYDEFLPPAMMYNPAGAIGFPILLHPYTMNWHIWSCPSSPYQRSFRPGPSGTPSYLLSYIANYYMMPWGDTLTYPQHMQGAKLSRIERPAEQVLIGERGDVGYWGCTDINRLDRTLHNDGANYCFADGHAKWLAEGAFLSNVAVYWGTKYWFQT